MADKKKTRTDPAPEERRGSVKFVAYGLEMLAKEVKQSGNSGRIYLPPTWVGKRVKIVRVN